MGNIAQHKNATASGSFPPYLPARAVDGSLEPASRWMCNKLPAWLAVDLGDTFWINRWVVKQMGLAGWGPGHNICDYRLQLSSDNIAWYRGDEVAKNTAGQTDRTFEPMRARYARLNVTKGLQINNPLAAVMEFELYESDYAPYLASLALSAGTLGREFSSKVFHYWQATVPVDITQITVTPTAVASSSKIKVNGRNVASGQASQHIILSNQETGIKVTVASADGKMQETYMIKLTKVIPEVPLSGLGIIDDMGETVSLSPAFAPATTHYTAQAVVGNARVIPTAAKAVITVNGLVVESGSQSGPIYLKAGLNRITITVMPTGGGPVKTYTVDISASWT